MTRRLSGGLSPVMSHSSSDSRNINLGGRLRLLAPAQLTPEQRKLYDDIDSTAVPWAEANGFQVKTAEGNLIGPFNPALLSPQISARFLALQREEEEQTSLNERVRQVVILTVGSVWESPYELYAHAAIARKNGWSDTAISALVAGRRCAELSNEEPTAQEFTRQLTRNRAVDDELFAFAKATFGVKGVADLVFLAGCYLVVCSFLNAFKVPAPEHTFQGETQC
jgi:4-carboxymuconolactone decarboxylase